jgi:hypothetical protein
VTTVPETIEFPRSSNLASATYDPDVENLVITFQSGESYTYFNVPASVYRGLTLAGSAGTYFHRSIRSRYAYEQG